MASDNQTEKVVIIGSGPAGWTAAIYAARAGLSPLVYEGANTSENQTRNTLPLGQLALTTEVENWPATPPGDTRQYLKTALPEENQPYWVQRDKPQPTHGFNGPELMELMRQQARHFGTRIVTDDIKSVDFAHDPAKGDPFLLHTLEGGVVRALTVIVATGARANYLGLPSEDRFKNNGVSACAVCDGALPRFKNRPVVVVGGGDTAIEEASYLARYASRVFLVHRRDKLRASQAMQQRAFDNPKMTLKWNAAVDEVLGTDQAGVTGVRLKSTVGGPVEELEAAGLFLGIGHTPNTDFLGGQLELTETKYLALRPSKDVPKAATATSVEGVFAAGDVADDYYRQACTAAGSGCMAALDAERWLSHHGLV
jgi:thioredoxin reductase (NADPH)